jgi:hypothetical protein
MLVEGRKEDKLGCVSTRDWDDRRDGRSYEEMVAYSRKSIYYLCSNMKRLLHVILRPPYVITSAYHMSTFVAVHAGAGYHSLASEQQIKKSLRLQVSSILFLFFDSYTFFQVHVVKLFLGLTQLLPLILYRKLFPSSKMNHLSMPGMALI